MTENAAKGSLNSLQRKLLKGLTGLDKQIDSVDKQIDSVDESIGIL